jgi:hypothetical protein
MYINLIYYIMYHFLYIIFEKIIYIKSILTRYICVNNIINIFINFININIR